MICKEQAVELKVNNPSNQLTYRWYTDAAFSGFMRQGISVVTSPLMSDTVFYVEAMSGIGCSIKDSVKVKLYPFADLQTGDLDICSDSIAIPQASSADAVSLKWYSDAGFSDFIVQANSFETAKLKRDTVFYIEALSTNGCATRDSVKVTVYDILVEDLSVCYDATATVSVSTTGGSSIAWYRNHDYTDFIAGTASFETAKLSSDTVFYVEALSSKGCIAKNSVKVTVNRLPELSVSDTSVCFGTTITFTTVTDAVSQNWYSDAAYNNLINRAVSYTTTASANVVFYIEAFSNEACSVRDSIELSIILPPSVKAMDDLYLRYGEEVTLDVLQSDGYVSWNVSPVTFKAELSQEYIVTASRPPCPEARDSVTITVGDFYIPKVFTPNGDGINDIFMQGYEIIVFDRIGIVIFKGDNGWDGTYQNKPVPRHIYFYKLNRKLDNGGIKVYSGYIGVQ
jgi:gliding motility-associated-like protein